MFDLSKAIQFFLKFSFRVVSLLLEISLYPYYLCFVILYQSNHQLTKILTTKLSEYRYVVFNNNVEDRPVFVVFWISAEILGMLKKIHF